VPDTPAAFLVLDDALAALGEGSPYELRGEEGRHAAKVARIRAGERILLSDADGRQAGAEVTEARKEELSLRLLEAPSDPVLRIPRLSLVQALATGGRDEQAIESATELGVDRVTPWIAHRSVSVWKGEKLRKGRARWENTVRAAVKQCRRRGIPAVDEARTSARLVEDLRARCAEGALVLVLHEQESVGLMSIAEELRALRVDGGADRRAVRSTSRRSWSSSAPRAVSPPTSSSSCTGPVRAPCCSAPRCCGPRPPAPRPSP
jgi:16S rRNA (uracil1498-N3)-methyltransferase